ncbi:type II toxin-antitoxin system Phd/YefM family antitoxin [Sphingomonas edaphi]|uniref:Antitoxin n=1 Tax=Sphingomonas edaphi TaxID=2315689 RepID=A0A418PYR4_9SPHN|nr:type II toxin-antitoxin system prevent-host-death family antitoxin [Sphingomonas edaphi]RIX27250.1 type II toxin-antitoxin system prevent-host-death family antitoxin [Sphingomonas edaphi]
MDVVNYSDARQKLKEMMDRVVADMTQIVITRQKADAVVMMSLAEWNSILETLHLLSSPTNAERLISAMAELEAGEGVEHELMDDDELVGA